jgi:hypothetical protein
MTRYRVQAWRKTPLYIIIDAESADDAALAALEEFEANGDAQFSEGEPEQEIACDPEEAVEVDDHSLIVAIQEILSGKVWSPESLQAVADVLQEAGYMLKEVEDGSVSAETAA